MHINTHINSTKGWRPKTVDIVDGKISALRDIRSVREVSAGKGKLRVMHSATGSRG
jgi:hypothetical protein